MQKKGEKKILSDHREICELLDRIFEVGSSFEIKTSGSAILVADSCLANVNLLTNEIYIKIQSEMRLENSVKQVECSLQNGKVSFSSKVQRYMHPFLILKLPSELILIEERLDKRHNFKGLDLTIRMLVFNEAHYGVGHETEKTAELLDISLTGVAMLMRPDQLNENFIPGDSIKLHSIGPVEMPVHCLGKVVYQVKVQDYKRNIQFKIGIHMERKFHVETINALLALKT